MVGTLPGRTQGLGLITEPLLKDLQIDRVLFAHINLWATLIGALFCVGVGRLIDRFGSRSVLTAVSIMLGAVVLLMSSLKGVILLALVDYADARAGAERAVCHQHNDSRPVVCAKAESGYGHILDSAQRRLYGWRFRSWARWL